LDEASDKSDAKRDRRLPIEKRYCNLAPYDSFATIISEEPTEV
jgi:hypothetical protein